MTWLKLLGIIALLTICLIPSVTYGQLSATTKTQMRLGIKDVQSALDYGKELVEDLKPLANCLGIFGAFVTLAMLFVPSQESAEMKFMKQQFAQINMKLDQISNKIDNVESLVKYESQREAYVQSSKKITFGFTQLQQFQDEISANFSCSTQQACERERIKIAEKYLDSFDVKEDVYAIMTGTSGPGAVFDDPLLDLVNNYHKCDIGKVFDFANGVISLAFKGQYVVLAHEKFTGTNQSITNAMKDWSDMAYNIRKKADSIKLQCYKKIKKYISTDVTDTKYQTGYDENKAAADALKSFLDEKYPWIVWTVLSYGGYGSQNHMGFQSFINMPKSNRKRVLRVIASDNGTYTSASNLASHIKNTLLSKLSYDDGDHAAFLLKRIKYLIGTSTVDKLLSLVVLMSKEISDIEYADGTSWPKVNKVVVTTSQSGWDKAWGSYKKHQFRVFAMFASDKQISGVYCDKNCQNSGTCENIPLTSKSYCICSDFFYGESCEHYDTVKFAANVDSMLTTDIHIPTVADVYFKLEDMQAYIAASLNNIQLSIVQLNKMLQDKLTTEFQLTDLLTDYSESIDELTYHLQSFQALKSSDPTYATQSKALANAVIAPDGINKWLFDLNFLIVGRQEVLMSHEPLIIEKMQNNKNEACNANYKNILDTTWQQLMSLQTSAYIMWATSLAILHQSSDDITLEHNQKVLTQTSFMKTATCQLKIPNSVTANCSGGYYLYPGMTIKNQCEENYYLVGNANTSCDKPSSCLACGCYHQGSVSQECDDQTGKCHCISGFYGEKCNDSDCAWSSWGKWSACPNQEDYDTPYDAFGELGVDPSTGGAHWRFRSKTQEQHGAGDACTGEAFEALPCMNEFGY